MHLSLDDLRAWLEYRSDRASGPGGQNVNKVNTRVAICFDFQSCTLLNSDQKSRIAARLATRLDRRGRLRVVSQSERSQLSNREAAEQVLLKLLAQALAERRKRHATQPTRGSQVRRLSEKKQRGEAKRRRRGLESS